VLTAGAFGAPYTKQPNKEADTSTAREIHPAPAAAPEKFPALSRERHAPLILFSRMEYVTREVFPLTQMMNFLKDITEKVS
jgi:hypothetical protein